MINRLSQIAITVIFVLFLVACNNEVMSDSEIDDAAGLGDFMPEISPHFARTFSAVINNEMPFTFFGFSGTPLSDWMHGSHLVWSEPTFEQLYFDEYFKHPTIIYTWEISRFSIVDLGSDGNVQLILQSEMDGDILILHLAENGEVHGFGILQRQFRELKTDGTFLQLSWMQDWGAIAQLNFVPDNATSALELIFLHQWQVGYDDYDDGFTLFLDGEYVDFEEGWPIVEEIKGHHGGKESAIWLPFDSLPHILNSNIIHIPGAEVDWLNFGGLSDSQDIFGFIDTEVYLEGTPLPVTLRGFGEIVDSNTEGRSSFVIYIDTNRFSVVQRTNFIRAENLHRLHHNQPTAFIEVAQIEYTNVSDAVLAIKENLDFYSNRHAHVSHSLAANDFPFDVIFVWEGGERDGKVTRVYVRDNAHGGVFVIWVQTSEVAHAFLNHARLYVESLEIVERLPIISSPMCATSPCDIHLRTVNTSGEFTIHYQDHEVQYASRLEGHTRVLYAIEMGSASMKEIARFPSISQQLTGQELSDDHFIWLCMPREIVHFEVINNWIILSVGHFHNVRGVIDEDIHRVARDGSGRHHLIEYTYSNHGFVIINGWIYHYSLGEMPRGSGWVRVRLNGTDKHFVDHVSVSSVSGSNTMLYATRYTHGEIAVWSNSMLENVRLTEVRIGSEGDDMYLYPGETLSSPILEMEPYTLFQINKDHFVGSTIPSTALSFTDPNGHIHHFMLAISGYDGSVDLFPYPLAEIREQQQPIELYAAYKNTHVVVQGDVLFRIALAHDTTWEVLAEYNELKNPHLIFPGQVIRIPVSQQKNIHMSVQPLPDDISQRTHIVQVGESLSSISRMYYNGEDIMGFMQMILEYNDIITSGSVIFVGQKLLIPSTHYIHENDSDS